MRRMLGSTTVLALALALALPVLAQDKTMEKKAEAKPAAAAAAGGAKADLLRSLGDAQKKLISLAEAMPAEKYTWRPGEGVRSVGEVFAHVSGANFFIPTLWGAKMPAGVDPRGFEKEGGDKAKTVDTLKKSFDHVTQAIQNLPDADLGKAVKIFDHEGTYREAVLVVVSHAHEHLGQSIAYARSNGVVPPWSQKGQ
ncbi:MAG TPA: DinB family protein [Thermoanaerobaculia bacterium]|nr:DinB family protein [Thermoanaerobaculia bacterium]